MRPSEVKTAFCRSKGKFNLQVIVQGDKSYKVDVTRRNGNKPFKAFQTYDTVQNDLNIFNQCVKPVDCYRVEVFDSAGNGLGSGASDEVYVWVNYDGQFLFSAKLDFGSWSNEYCFNDP